MILAAEFGDALVERLDQKDVWEVPVSQAFADRRVPRGEKRTALAGPAGPQQAQVLRGAHRLE